MPAFKSILCPVDFSDCSHQALKTATELAVSSNASLTIVNIWQPPMFGTPDVPIAPELIQDMVDDAGRNLAECEASAKAAGAKTVRSMSVTGAPWNEIVKLLDTKAYDLVVMGTHGRTGLKHVLLSSVAEKVVRHAPCAVLVVR